MPLAFDHARCLAPAIGAAGLDPALLEAGRDRLARAVASVRARHEAGDLPLLDLPGDRDDLAAIAEAATRLTRGASDILVLGTGGSSLGGQTLAQVAGWNLPGAAHALPRLHFLDNLDPHSLGRTLDHLLPETTCSLIVSKSGGTSDTLLQAMALRHWFDRLSARRPLAEHVVLITEPEAAPGHNKLRALFAGDDVLVLDHPTGIGGRYAGLTAVGLVPAAILGLDGKAARVGAARAVAPFLSGDAVTSPAAMGALLAVLSAEHHDLTQTVVMAYADRLERFTRWFTQLWSESLGKGGRGLTPIPAVGPVDQHSQVQLFLDGPRDKLATVVMVDTAGQGPAIAPALAEKAGEPGFGEIRIGDFVWAQQQATVDTLAARGRPVRTITLPEVSAETIGELMMHFMIETIVTAELLGVNAFDQPAVEDGKVRARQYLAAARADAAGSP